MSRSSLVRRICVPSGRQAGNDLHIREGLEGIQEATDALGPVVAGLTFENTHIRLAVELLGDCNTQGIGCLTLGIAYDGTDGGGEVGNIRS